MSHRNVCGFFSAAIMAASLAVGAPVTANASLSNFLQDLQITNTSATETIVAVQYTLGTPADNIATWDSSTGGGTSSDPLSDPNFFQTITWTGLNIGPAGSQSLGGLDIDLIVTVLPLNVTGGSIGDGQSLRNASVTVTFDTAQQASAALSTQAGWGTDQQLSLVEQGNGVPEPSTYLMISPAILALFALRRR